MELAICPSGYEECYDKRDPEALKTVEFFKKSIPDYIKILYALLGKKPTAIYQLPRSSILLLDKSGIIHTFKDFNEDEIEIVELTDSASNPDFNFQEEKTAKLPSLLPPSKTVDLLKSTSSGENNKAHLPKDTKQNNPSSSSYGSLFSKKHKSQKQLEKEKASSLTQSSPSHQSHID